ncbi:alpha/beta hydrolase family protein [Aquimarina macrocephali]|uniref:alpha/beta hydrolase family protein n=1 Tax=Aquimarina macrocephali TaxID=666563 RepID=UPI0004669B35|nr:lipase family protein [Aquimarina macrocephali]
MTIDNITKINEEYRNEWKHFLTYDIDIYSIVYNSLYKNNLVELLGLIIVPSSIDSLSLIQYHHGTMIPIASENGEGINDAPSLFKGQAPQKYADFYETRLLCTIMASNGFIVSAPDYAGYNVTAHLNHPYTFHHELAESSVDMLRATESLIKELGVNYSTKIFLAGWSEGGVASLATQKYLEELYNGEFNLIANAPFAGPYDYDTFGIDVFKKKDEKWSELGIYSWAGHVWNEFGNINRPADQIWNFEVNHPIEALNLPSSIPSQVFKSSFIDNIENGNDREIISIMEENDLIDGWTPKAKVFLHHGINDDIVPYFNTENAYNSFLNNGSDVTLYRYGGNHCTPIFEYLTNLLKDFNQL